MTGYITKADAEEEGETVSLKIPNNYIASIFEDTVIKLFKETIDANMQKSMMEAFWNKDAEEARRNPTKKEGTTISELKKINYTVIGDRVYQIVL